MVKTPEQYFQDHDFHLPGTENLREQSPCSEDCVTLTAAEQAFLFKYVGMESAQSMGLDLQLSQQEMLALIPITPPLEEELKQYQQLQIIFFQLQDQTFTIPVEAVQEVIRYQSPMRLPMSPHFLAGIINLRGRVTPLVFMDKLLFGASNSAHACNEKFIIVCQRRGIQFGMIIDRIENMYIIAQKNISWNVEAEIGASIESICGILEHETKIFGIVSVDKIVNQVLQTRGIK